MLTKTFIVFVLFMIIASLGTAMVYLLKDRDRSPRTVKALTARIGMSLALFFLLLLGYSAGILHPHGLNPTGPQPQAGGAGAAPGESPAR